MKKVFSRINEVASLFVTQAQEEAMTPLCNIEGIGKGRRFYFKGDTAYSYRDDFPLAKIKNGEIYIKNTCPSNTTKKHRRAILYQIGWQRIIFSNDLKNPISYDNTIKGTFKRLMYAKKNSIICHYKDVITQNINQERYPITKSKFPLLFDEKHEKVKKMFFSNDRETFNLAKKIIKQQKLITW